MRKVFGIIPTILAVGMLVATATLGGCAQLQTAASEAKTLYEKVVGIYSDAPKTVYVLETGYTAVQSAAVAFKNTQCKSVTDLGGKCATIVPKLRELNARALAAIKPVEDYVRANPTLDVTSLITTAQNTVLLVSQEMTALGVPPV